MLKCGILNNYGEIELPVPIYERMKDNILESHIANYNSFVILSHFKRHTMRSFEGAMKSLSIYSE